LALWPLPAWQRHWLNHPADREVAEAPAEVKVVDRVVPAAVVRQAQSLRLSMPITTE